MEIPEINKRLRQLIDNKANGNVNKFAEMINFSQQKVNRLFNIDSRTGKYPSIPSDILTCITEMFVDVDIRWLLTGKYNIIADKEANSAEEPFCKYTPSPPPCEKCKMKDELIESLRHGIATQDKYIARLEAETQKQEQSAATSPEEDGQKKKGILIYLWA